MTLYRVAIHRGEDLYETVSPPLCFADAVEKHDSLRAPGESLPIDRDGNRLSILVLKKGQQHLGLS